MNKFIRIINTLIITVGCAFFLLACYDLFGFLDSKKSEDGVGTFSLEIGSGGASRTILPANTNVNSFTEYSLVFTPASGSAETFTRTNSTLSTPFSLTAGTWSLTVTAKIGSDAVAEGTLTGITITSGGSTSETLNLKPIVTGGGTGTFKWIIGYPDEVTDANMVISPIGTGSPQSVPVIGAAKNSSIPLDIGYYKVVFTLEHPANDIIWVEYLHIYKNLISTFTFTFPPEYFTGGPPSTIAVTDITDVPTTGTVGTALTLSGTVEPSNATNQVIVWSIKTQGGTSSTLSGNSVTATAAGILEVTATITDGIAVGTDYTKDFSITFSGGSPTFVAVNDITDVPTAGTVGTALTLTGTVEPSNATNQVIVWSIKTQGGTSSTLSGNSVTATAEGTLTVTATITDGTAVGTDYTKDFSITFIVPVSNITGVPSAGAVGIELDLNPAVDPSNATNQTIVWTVTDADGTGITSIPSTNKVTASAAGTLQIRATITNGTAVGTNYTKDFSIVFSTYGITLSPNNATYDPYVIATSPLTVTVSNPAGNGATGALTVVLSGTNSTDFNLSTSSLTTIAAGANTTFTVTPEAGLVAGTYTATVTVSGGNGISAALNVSFTVAAPGAIILTFEIKDNAPVIPAIPTLSKSGTPGGTPNSKVTLTATGDFDTITWSVDDAVSGTGYGEGTSFDLDADDYDATLHTLTVAGFLTDGAPYSRTVPFTVEN
jgi:hypothetical protein